MEAYVSKSIGISPKVYKYDDVYTAAGFGGHSHVIPFFSFSSLFFHQ
jgi:hypothetical protein